MWVRRGLKNPIYGLGLCFGKFEIQIIFSPRKLWKKRLKTKNDEKLHKFCSKKSWPGGNRSGAADRKKLFFARRTKQGRCWNEPGKICDELGKLETLKSFKQMKSKSYWNEKTDCFHFLKSARFRFQIQSFWLNL